ncbi:endolytic transglycosylase MltG [Acetilactobacillus jinshanensis]|uniref:Aminodeoxychorismate lyase n=1 Tax=Acetilactobacillus jinshanensis TaxID=1720083 RepID=A0A4P6ZLL8_9LACO|nr:endolytic transglycosylase MltG [Acetilactobacillus jinshanensis]QBP18654.1 hypothetical protein ELX58_05825 [Acetilactobacillus jinshanensis]URL61530.1 endolytic transglycosylase MltG [uncultured bacterium]
MNSQTNSAHRPPSRFGKKIIVSVIVILVILGFCLFLLGRNYMKESLKPLKPHSDEIIEVKVPLGASDRKIGSLLQQRKVVRNGLAFNYYIKSHDVKNLKAGYYWLSPSMSLKKITNQLRTGGTKRPVRHPAH